MINKKEIISLKNFALFTMSLFSILGLIFGSIGISRNEFSETWDHVNLSSGDLKVFIYTTFITGVIAILFSIIALLLSVYLLYEALVKGDKFDEGYSRNIFIFTVTFSAIVLVIGVIALSFNYITEYEIEDLIKNMNS